MSTAAENPATARDWQRAVDAETIAVLAAEPLLTEAEARELAAEHVSAARKAKIEQRIREMSK